jgi:hypothetical protein
LSHKLSLVAQVVACHTSCRLSHKLSLVAQVVACHTLYPRAARATNIGSYSNFVAELEFWSHTKKWSIYTKHGFDRTMSHDTIVCATSYDLHNSIARCRTTQLGPVLILVVRRRTTYIYSCFVREVAYVKFWRKCYLHTYVHT